MAKSNRQKKIKREDEIARLKEELRNNEEVLPINQKMLHMIKDSRRIENDKIKLMEKEIELIEEHLKSGLDLFENPTYKFQEREEYKEIFLWTLKHNLYEERLKVESWELNDMREKHNSKDKMNSIERLNESLERIPMRNEEIKIRIEELEKVDTEYIG